MTRRPKVEILLKSMLAQLTSLTNKDLLGGTGGSFTHSIVDAHADLIATVFVQICKDGENQ